MTVFDEGRLRFSLKTMLAMMTFGSMMIAAVVAFPDAYATGSLIALLQVVPLILLFGVIWGSRNQRVFCVGALLPAGLTLVSLAPVWILSVVNYGYDDDWNEAIGGIGQSLVDYHNAYRIIAVVSWLSSLLLGLIALALRRWVFPGSS